MKKLFGLFATLLLSISLAACGGGTILVDEKNDYYATGAHAGWGDATSKPQYKMEAVALNDSRIATLRSQLDGATYVYVFEVTLSENETWTKDYTINGTLNKFNGGLTLKIIRTEAGDDIPAPWMPSPESGELTNLTPNLLYMPPYRDESLNSDGAGFNNSDPVALKAGSYYLVFAVLPQSKKVMGLIAK
jgi:hypothetical protein